MDEVLGAIVAMVIVSLVTLAEKVNKPRPEWVACQALVENTPGAVKADFKVCGRYHTIHWGL